MKVAAARSPRNEPFRLKPRLSRHTLQDSVYENLRSMLMAGEFSPGDRLTVRGVATAMGTSVMPVREAFKRLTSEGALEPLSTGATRLPLFDIAKLQDITEIRMHVEGLAVRRAARRVTPQELENIIAMNNEALHAVRTKDRSAETRANEKFHFALYRASESRELLRIITQLWLQTGPWIAWLIKESRWPENSKGTRPFRHHDEMITALRRGNEDAAERAIRADISEAADILIACMRESRNKA